MVIKALAAQFLEKAINHYLSLDEDASQFLSPLQGKVIAINILPFEEIIYCCPSSQNIQILEQHYGAVDTTISGTLSALGLMGLSASPMRAIFNGEVSIEGDTQVARQFQQLFDQLDADLEEKLSHFSGDIIAHQIGNLVRSGQQWSKESLESFRLNLEEFLQEETRNLPAKAEADLLFNEIETLRSDFDRLTQHIEQLKTKITE